MKEGTGQSALRLPVARTDSRLSADAPNPPPLAQNDAPSLRTSPGKITNDPTEIVDTNQLGVQQRSEQTQLTARTASAQTQAKTRCSRRHDKPQRDVRLCQNQRPTTRAPSRAGRSPKHGKPSNEASERTTPTSDVNPKRPPPRAIRRRASQVVRVHAQPLTRSRLANDHANSANPEAGAKRPETLRRHQRGASHQPGTSHHTLVTVPSGLLLRV
jgi:hypothetical protein